MVADRRWFSSAAVGRHLIPLLGTMCLVAGATGIGAARVAGAADRTPGSELTTTTRLADRRALVTGDRWYSVSAEDGTWPAAGFHTRGEMGGIWSPPIKLLDGIWFGVNGQWLSAASFTSGYGYARRTSVAGGVQINRIDFAPDGVRAGLFGLSLTAPGTRSVTLTVDAHSELMKVYPWGETTPSQLAYNLPDSGAFDGTGLVFTEQGTPPVANTEAHDYAAVVGAVTTTGAGGAQGLSPTGHALGPGFRGPQDPPVICPASGPGTPTPPTRCDDTAYGKGTGGQLTYHVPVQPGRPTTVWVAVAGSDHGVADARAQEAQALADPAGGLAQKAAQRSAVAARTSVDLPGDRLLQQSVEWTKQNLADSVQHADNLQLRPTNAGQVYPPPVGTVAHAQWIAAGFPDYPWLFGTDGEYTAFAAVAAGDFTAIESHLRALQQVSDIVNQGSGKVVHEVVSDGSVYFGTNTDPGNTDETAKFPSAVALVWRWTGDNAFRDSMYDFAVRNMHYIYAALDQDGDGWPEGLGNVERPGMGVEKLDVTAYTIRGLRDLADMAASKGDQATYRWASDKATSLESGFESTWWFGRSANQYADSLADPGNIPVFQRHWIGLTPLDALLVRPGQTTEPLASVAHGQTVLDGRQQACYSDVFGLYHTGTGPTSDPAGNPGPSCDSEVSTVKSERTIFSLNTAIMAVSEGNYGRMGADQQQRYTTANARIQLDPTVWEQPGAMPEIAPSPDFGANIDKPFTERSSVLQAWGAYGVLWPVVSQQLGVAPDLGRSQLAIIPEIPSGQTYIAGRDISLGAGAVDVSATRAGHILLTVATVPAGLHLALGAVLPAAAHVAGVRLNGMPVAWTVQSTARGEQLVVDAGSAGGRLVLEIHL